METIGNKRANDYWEHNIPSDYHKPNPKSTAEEREQWIRAKYQQQQFIDTTRGPPVGSLAPSPQPTTRPEPLTPTSTPSAPTPTPAPTLLDDTPTPLQKIHGIEFVGYGFFNFLDDPTRPILRRQMRLFKNTFEENKTSHVSVHNGPPGTRQRGVEFLVADHFSVDTSSVRGFVPASTKVFEKKEEYDKFLASHTNPQLDSYRQTVSMHSDHNTRVPAGTDSNWHVVTETRVELYELFVDQIDEEGLSPHVVKASSLLLEGDPALLAQFIKKNGTHFVRSAVYGGRTLMKTLVDKSVVPEKDEAARLCTLNFKSVVEGEAQPASADDLRKVQNYTLDVTGGDNKKRGLDWIDSIWDKPQVLSYDMESISAVFDDLSLSVKVEAAVKEHIDRVKG